MTRLPLLNKAPPGRGSGGVPSMSFRVGGWDEQQFADTKGGTRRLEDAGGGVRLPVTPHNATARIKLVVPSPLRGRYLV
jgi:hypothetical protein